MYSKILYKEARQILNACEHEGMMLATAESCTGGLVAALFTEIPGSSSVFERGFVTYSNDAKQALLGVKPTMLARHGAVSDKVASAMAQGAIKASKADISVAVTGIAGPGGGTKTKPVGLVYIAVSHKKGKTCVEEHHFKGSRSEVRLKAVAAALSLIKASLGHSS